MIKLRVQAAGLSLLINLLVIPVATALGLGDVTVRSALNEPLKATIEVISARASDLQGITARLASNSAFENARIERPAYLDKLQFTVDVSTASAPVVRIVTQRPFREPFVHLLLEVNWSQGRLRREYTLLLDPPSAVSRPPVGTAPVTQASRSSKGAVKKSTPVVAGDSQYGPTGKNETLWSIASKLARRQGVSTQQMMLSLLETNPQAFHGDNINSMKPGVTLQVPSAAQARVYSNRDAIRQVGQHNTYWASVGADPTRLPLRAGQTATVAAAKRPAVKTARVAKQPPKQLKIVTPTITAASKAEANAAKAAVERLSNELILANESAESRRLENKELRSRLTRLEDNVDKMQRLISLKDDEIGSLQQRVATLQEDVGKARNDAKTDPSVAVPVTKVADNKVGTSTAPIIKATEQKIATQPTSVKPQAKPKPKFDPKNFIIEPEAPPSSFVDDLLDDPILVLALVGVVGGLLIFALIKVRRKKDEEDDEEGDEEETLLVNADSEDDEEGSQDEAKTDKKKAKWNKFDFKKWISRFGRKGYVDDDEEDNLSAVAAVGVGAGVIAGAATLLPDDEIEIPRVNDPLAEANTLIGEGRLDEASVALSKGLHLDPSNEQLQLKLLEVFSLAGDAGQFETRAEAFYADRNGLDDGAWSKVVQWGRPLCPQNPLFMDAAPDSSELLDFDNDLIELDDLDLNEGLEGLTSADIDLGSDLGLEDSVAEVSGLEDETDLLMASAEEVDGLDDMDLLLDLSDDGLGKTDKDVIPGLEMEIGEIDDDIDMSDFQSEVDEIVIPSALPIDDGLSDMDDLVDNATKTHRSADEGLDFPDLGLPEDGEDDDVEFDLSGINIESDKPEDDGVTFDISEGDDLEVDFGDLEPETGEVIGDAAALPADSFPASDEVDTKLDLARAYIDMGDPDGAKTMLEEVVEDGSDTQKNEAQSLLSQLS